MAAPFVAEAREAVAVPRAWTDGEPMKERWSLFLLGAWLMGSVILFVVAPTNFRLIDELLQHSDNPSFRATVQQVGPGPSRDLLRYLSSELNRDFFLRWNVLQTSIGAALLALSWRPPAERRVRNVVLVATLLVAGLLLVLTPLITGVGRALDFVPREPPPPDLGRFKLLHVAYTAIELVKVGCVALAAFWSLRAGSSVQGGANRPRNRGMQHG
jgi:hypothetical protein